MDVDLLDIPPTVDLPSLDLGFIPPEPTLTPTPEPEEPGGGGQEGCLVYDQNQQDWVCQAPCPPEWEGQSPDTCTK